MKDKTYTVHLLGCHLTVEEYTQVAKEKFTHVKVRSGDTALAYIFAQGEYKEVKKNNKTKQLEEKVVVGIEMGKKTAEQRLRPPGDIDFIDGVVDEKLLLKNIDYMDKEVADALSN
jgi:hypothetical protein